jgi:hypothetical protein
LIAQAVNSLDAVRQAVHAGDPQRALESLQAAQSQLGAARKTLESVREARASCQRDLPDRVRETRRLREAMTQYEAFEDELRREYAAGSWQAVSGHLEQARRLLATFDGKTDEAREAASDASQTYLQAARLLAQVSQEQLAVLQLMSAVGDELASLRAIRDDCQRSLATLDDEDRATQRYFLQNDRVIGNMARGSVDAARESREQVSSLQRQRQPDWPRIQQALSGAHEEYAIALNQAQADVQAYEQLSSERARVQREAERVRAFLSSRQEDRFAANQHLQNAEEALEGARSEGASGEWTRCLELVRGAAADLAHAERLAQEDIRLAQQAEAEIREASVALGKTRGYLSMGVPVGTMDAESQLALADQLYRAQDYEQAIRTASGAIQQLRQAQAQAAQQAALMQMAAEANRRRMAMPVADGGILGVGGMAAGGAAMTTNPAPPPATEARPAAESGTAAGSWSSETAEGNW